jgi:hypothetical protein
MALRSRPQSPADHVFLRERRRIAHHLRLSSGGRADCNELVKSVGLP